MSALAEVHRKARQFGFTLTDEQAEHILWSKTGFPCFFSSRKTMLQGLQKHLYDFFAFAKRIGIKEALSHEEETRYYEHGPR